MNSEPNRTTLVIACAAAFPLLAALWTQAKPGSYEAFGYPLFGLFLVWIITALLRARIATKVLLTVSHVAMSAYWLGLLVVRLFDASAAGPAPHGLTPDLYMVLLMLSVIAHLVFRTPRALQASAGILLASSVVVGTWILSPVAASAGQSDVGRVVTYQGILAVAMLMLYVLARSKDDHAKALVEAGRLHDIAYSDSLTGLPNRRSMRDYLARFLALAQRHGDDLSVIFFDLDHFKHVNDTYGHGTGDAVLVEASRVVSAQLRSSDVFGRWGGEEFLVVTPREHHEGAVELAERIREALAVHTFPSGARVTASFGVATSSATCTVDSLVHRADCRLYTAKRLGRNRVGGSATCRARPATLSPAVPASAATEPSKA